MYEDNRTINSSGLLTAKRQRYVPKPIKTGLMSSANRPADDWINPSKEQVENDRRYAEQQAQIYEQQARAQMAQQNQKKGGKIICTRMHELGFIEKRLFMADQLYGELLQLKNPGLMEWYHGWAEPLVKKLHGNTWKSRLLIKLVWLFVKPWSKQMAYLMGMSDKRSIAGLAIMNISEVVYKMFYNHETYFIEDK